MFNYRNKGAGIFSIKKGLMGKVRLLFFIVNNPYGAMQVMNEFREEHGKFEAEIVSLKEKYADEKLTNVKLREEIYSLRRELEMKVTAETGARLRWAKQTMTSEEFSSYINEWKNEILAELGAKISAFMEG
jgi:DNA recombination-dependent growth factor C